MSKPKKYRHVVPMGVSRFVVNPVRATRYSSLSLATASFYSIPITGDKVALTTWLEGKPTMPGVYLVRFVYEHCGVSKYRVGFCHFNGEKWGRMSDESPIDAERGANAHGRQDKEYRGLYRDLFVHERAKYNNALAPVSRTLHSLATPSDVKAMQAPIHYPSVLAKALTVAPKRIQDVIQGAAAALADSQPVPLGAEVAKITGKSGPAVPPSSVPFEWPTGLRSDKASIPEAEKFNPEAFLRPLPRRPVGKLVKSPKPNKAK